MYDSYDFLVVIQGSYEKFYIMHRVGNVNRDFEVIQGSYWEICYD